MSMADHTPQAPTGPSRRGGCRRGGSRPDRGSAAGEAVDVRRRSHGDDADAAGDDRRARRRSRDLAQQQEDHGSMVHQPDPELLDLPDRYRRKQLADNSDSAVVALTMLASHAQHTGATVNALEDAGKITQLYVW